LGSVLSLSSPSHISQHFNFPFLLVFQINLNILHTFDFKLKSFPKLNTGGAIFISTLLIERLFTSLSIES